MTGEERLEEGNRFLELEQYEEALKAYKQVSEFHPRFREACYNKGTVLRRLERYEEALKAYGKVTEIDPENPRAWNYKGFALDELERYEEALEAYKKAIRLDSTYFRAWHNKGIVLDSLGRHKKALKAYKRAIKIKPNDADFWYAKAYTLDELGKYEMALKAYDKAIEINPKHAGAWNNKGAALHKLARYRKAKAAFEKATTIDPEDAVAHTNVGDVLFRLLDFDGASGKVEEALTINPNLADALTLQGSIQIEKRDYGAAIESFRKAIPLDADNPWLLLWFAYAEYLNAEFSVPSEAKGPDDDKDPRDKPEEDRYRGPSPAQDVEKEKGEGTPRKEDKKYREKMLSIMRGLERAEELCERRGKAVAETRALILYLLGCFYHKDNDIFGAKEKLRQCIRLKSSIRPSARALLRKIWNFEFRPSWWDWWIASPSFPWGKRILFGFVLLSIVGLLALHPLIGEWIRPFEIDSVMYWFFIALLLFLLLSPRIERFKAKDVEVELRTPTPFEFVLSPAMMEEMIGKAEKYPKR